MSVFTTFGEMFRRIPIPTFRASLLSVGVTNEFNITTANVAASTKKLASIHLAVGQMVRLALH